MDELKQFLIDKGFNIFDNTQFYNEIDWFAQRKINCIVTHKCETNGNVYLNVCPWKTSFSTENVVFELCGENNKVWYKINAYSITPEEVMENLDNFERRLANAWNAICS